MMPRRATYKCPKCDSKDIVPISYGYPTHKIFEESNLGKVKLGGCVIEIDGPKKHCNDCNHYW